MTSTVCLPDSVAGDPSSIAGAASVLTSLLDHGKDLSTIPPPQNREVLHSAVKSSSCEAANKASSQLDLKCHKRGTSVASNEKYGASSVLNGKETFLDHIGQGGSIGKLSGRSCELRPFLRMLFGSSTSDLDLSGSTLKVSADQSDLSKDLRSAEMLSSSARRKEFKDTLRRAILEDSDIEISFDSFPYFLR